MENKICPICKKEFLIPPCDVQRRKTCCQKCRGQYLHLLKINAPCASCGERPRVKKRSYCAKCGRILGLATYYKHKTSPNAKRLTPEERHQYKLKKEARYRERNRARLNERQRKYTHTHYDIILRNIENRRARKAGGIADLTQEQWEIIKAVYKFRCAYCGKKPKLLTKDHIIPISKGGGHTANNIVPACRGCNCRKHVNIPSSFQPILTWHWAAKPIEQYR